MLSDASSSADFLAMGTQVSMSSMMGDFYPEVDDVTRGLSLPGGIRDCCFGSTFDPFEESRLKGEDFVFRKADWCLPDKDRALLSPSLMFEEQDEALPVPRDSFFKLEMTSFTAQARSASLLGNRMICFLNSEADGVIRKVDRSKFSIRAEVCLDGLSCETKVRIYRQSCGIYIVEMQRRSGDGIAFNRLYRWASHYVSGGTGQQKALEEFHKVPSLSHGNKEASLATLLDLAKTSNKQLQTEAAQGLLQAAQDENLSGQLCTTQALPALQNLLQSDSFGIAEPLAHVLCVLSFLPEAQDMFTARHVLRVMVDMIWSKRIGKLVSERLAHAVHHLVVQNSVQLSSEVRAEVSSTLAAKVNDANEAFAPKDEAASFKAALRCLQKSLQQLTSAKALQV